MCGYWEGKALPPFYFFYCLPHPFFVGKVRKIRRKKVLAIFLPHRSSNSVFFFFWARNAKVGEKRFFGLISVFFSGKNRVSRPLFPAFLAFFSPIFEFLAHFFDFFLGLKIQFLGHNSAIFWFFSRAEKTVSRALFWNFSRVELFFSRAL